MCDENEECENATIATNATTTATVGDLTETTENKNETELSDKKQVELDDLLNELATVPPLKKCEVTYAYKWNVGNWTDVSWPYLNFILLKSNSITLSN